MNIYQLNQLIDDSYLINDCHMLKCIKTDLSFKEGIIFPDTYYYKKNMLASTILQKSHDILNGHLNYFFKNKDLNNELKKEEILILASIIEKEAGNNDEKFDISSVFLKRLSIDMKLQADPTIIYGLLLDSNNDLSNETELLLMFAARSELIDKKINTSQCDYLLLDRFYDASMAYQGYGRKLSKDFITSLTSFINCPIPDLSFLLDISVKEGFQTMQDMGRRMIANGDLNFREFERVSNFIKKIITR